ncbi:MAG: response regulator, partial [Lachnospiraceae bacterium]|nr:response regulator [Lachnospiraceae bacterium]
QVEGERHLYDWMRDNADRIKEEKTPFLFIDALNCSKGCICGTAVSPESSKTDDALYNLLDIREQSKRSDGGSAWSRCDTPEERLKHYNEQFAGLDINDYLRGYSDRSSECRYEIPDDERLDEIFVSMNKLTPDSRQINCTCCGYDSCRQMAIAIHNGFNHKENCIYYEKTMIRELEMEKAVAEEATRAKSSFLANMSHEIRTPINTVLGMNEMILRESDESNIVEYSENIRSAGSVLLGLVNNILDFSKIEAGKMEIQPVDYDLSSVANDLVNMIKAKADEKGLMLEIDFDPDIPKVLHGDELRIKQIISNMLTNAVKYTEKGRIIFRISHKETEDEKYIDLNVEVEDTGIGIKEEDISRLFEKFDRLELSRNRNIEGTGLGMSIAQYLLSLMGSKLEVKSVYGTGSRFRFVLRQEVVSRERLGDYSSAYRELVGKRRSYQEKFTAPSASVLVIDDNRMNLLVFVKLVKKTKVKVDTAISGDEGLQMMQDKKYDVIFFDHMMPDKDGIETLHEMRRRPDDPNADTPAICLTANAVSGAREMYIEAGFDDYLSKPVDSVKLENMLYDYLPKEKIEAPAGDDESSSKDGIKRILVIDEDPQRARKLRGRLKDSYSVDVLTSGDKLERFFGMVTKDKKVDLILLSDSVPDSSSKPVKDVLKDMPQTSDIPVRPLRFGQELPL